MESPNTDTMEELAVAIERERLRLAKANADLAEIKVSRERGDCGPFLGTLYGRPVIVSEFCKPLGSVGDAILADLSQYDIATGGETRQDVSVHVQFLTDQEVFRLAADTNGQPRWAEAVEDLHGTGKTSPFITLAAR